MQKMEIGYVYWWNFDCHKYILKQNMEAIRNYVQVVITNGPTRGITRYKMKCRYNLRRGVWGPLKPPQRKTILSVNRCINSEI